MLNLGDFESEEKRELDSLADSLRRDFPNPTRIGCPDLAILQGLVSRRLPYADVSKWLPHLSTCGECFKQFEDLQREAKQKYQRRTFWVAASAAVLVLVIAGWFLLRTGNQAGGPGTEVLDLRNVAPLSEAPKVQTAQVLVLHRSTRHLILKQANHVQGLTVEEIAVFTDSGTNLFDATARPKVQDQLLLIRIDIDLSRFDPGNYRLAIRRPGLRWTEYRLYLQ